MKIRNMVLCALFAALMCISAWISVPVQDMSFTLQTLVLFLSLGLLGGKRGSMVCLVYLLLGAAGLPVFSGFRGGIGVLLGTTGGYIAGFLAAALLYWAITGVFGSSFAVRLTASVAGLLACYTLGTVWFVCVYLHSGSPLGFGAVLIKCVVPYLLPDAVKLALALLLTARLKPLLPQ